MGGLILAGESIYLLPYLRRTFQTSMEAVFGLSAFEIGTLNALFGLLALLCYLPGGWLADRFSTRRLLATSLAATGAGGLYMATIPGYAELLALHAFWGVFSILTFWAALIKATRLWFPASAQGRAFGFLDGGRGAVAAILASAAALVFTRSESTEIGLISVIGLYSMAALGASAAIWVLLPDEHQPVGKSANGTSESAGIRPTGLRALARVETVLFALIIFCAYFLYVGSFEFPAYAERGHGQSKSFGAWLGAFRDWLRPVAAIAAGLLADRVSGTRVMTWLFASLVLAYGSLAAIDPALVDLALLWCQVAVAAAAVFALRGIYYVLLEETAVPPHATGLVVGAVSVFGYTPDILAPLISGWLVDQGDGAAGYRQYFTFLTALASLGMGASMLLARTTARARDAGPAE